MFPSTGDYERTIRENMPAGRNVGAPVTATDANNDRLTYSIPPSEFFEIVDSSGQLRTKVEPNHEDQASHTITVTATDPGNLTDTVQVTITVEDVDETPVVTGPTNPVVAENGNRDVATYTSTDPDRKGIEWVLTGTDSEDFTLSGGAPLFQRSTRLRGEKPVPRYRRGPRAGRRHQRRPPQRNRPGHQRRRAWHGGGQRRGAARRAAIDTYGGGPR